MSLLKKIFVGKKSSDITDKISFFIFNSNKIDDLVSINYGAYAQKKLIESIYNFFKPQGGWNSLPGKGLICSHGDLFEQDIFNKPTGITIIGKWIKDGSVHNIKLDSDFVESLKINPADINFIPYAIGVCPISDTITSNIHSLMDSDVTGYLGYFTMGPNSHLAYIEERIASVHEVGITGNMAVFTAIALTLSLPANRFGIRSSGEYWGWQLSETEMSKMELSLIRKD